MNALLRFSTFVDNANVLIGRNVKWLILVAVLVSAGNALSRYTLSYASNSMLELQWYLFAAVFTIAAGYTLRVNEHVRIDVVSQKLTARTRNWIDLIGFVVFVIPVCTYITLMSIPNLVESFNTGEVSINAGGLTRWPVRLLIPLGFGLLVIQAVSEAIKRWAFLKGLTDDPLKSGGHAVVEIATDKGEDK